METARTPHRLAPSLGEVLLAIAAAMAATTVVTAAAARATLRAENRRQP
jgi:hypothetical protein